jgi:hypothetical protein
MGRKGPPGNEGYHHDAGVSGPDRWLVISRVRGVLPREVAGVDEVELAVG